MNVKVRALDSLRACKGQIRVGDRVGIFDSGERATVTKTSLEFGYMVVVVKIDGCPGSAVFDAEDLVRQS